MQLRHENSTSCTHAMQSTHRQSDRPQVGDILRVRTEASSAAACRPYDRPRALSVMVAAAPSALDRSLTPSISKGSGSGDKKSQLSRLVKILQYPATQQFDWP